jgi:hypothetical protein
MFFFLNFGFASLCLVAQKRSEGGTAGGLVKVQLQSISTTSGQWAAARISLVSAAANKEGWSALKALSQQRFSAERRLPVVVRCGRRLRDWGSKS